MTLLADARMYARFAVGLRRFLRQRLTPGEAEAIIADRLARRESNFFRLLERGIYGYTASPYRALLRLARVELEDVRALVATRGLEGALAALREAGVSVSFEAFKGREPIVRNGRVITVKPRDFDNPFVQRHYEVESSGSTGAGTRVSHDLDHLGDPELSRRLGPSRFEGFLRGVRAVVPPRLRQHLRARLGRTLGSLIDEPRLRWHAEARDRLLDDPESFIENLRGNG